MPDIDDYSPIVERGELEATSGLFARGRRRKDLGPVESGFVRLLIGDDGSPLPSNDLTAGEKHWARPRSWIKVDIGYHTLDYTVGLSDPTGRAGFTARVSVRASVCDAGGVTRQGVTSVRDFVLPAVRRAVVQAGSVIEPSVKQNPIAALTETRQRADAGVRSLADGPVSGIPDWLEAEFVSVTLDFDDATRRHLAELVDRTRQGELVDVDSVVQAKKTKAELAMRTLWREELLPHLSDPAQRVFEVAFANPTQANLAKAVDQVSHEEMVLVSEGFELLKTMVNNDYVDKDDPFYAAILAMNEKMSHLYLRGTAAALSAGSTKAELPTAGDEPPTDALDHDPPDVEEERGDRDWTG